MPMTDPKTSAPAPNPADRDAAAGGLSSGEMDAIDAMHERLAQGHYELLGVARDATRPEVRAAYFEAMKRFHPDVYWGRDLSLYRPRLEAIHAALTKAFETLCDTARRRDYDAALEAAEAAARAPVVPPVVAAVEGRSAGLPPMPSRAITAAAPRAAPVRSAVVEEPSVPREVTQQSLARSRAEHVLRLRQEQLAQLDAQARAAEARGDVAAMVSFLRQALALAPDHEDMRRRLEEHEARRAATAHDRFAVAARTHERDRRWEAAHGAWLKALSANPQSVTALLGAVGAACEGLLDLQSAAELARKATQLDPRSADAHAALARVFFLAGRMASARGSAEAALRLDPQHAGAMELARRLKAR
jgi:tetratricopeptide (TPR) repeat protein